MRQQGKNAAARRPDAEEVARAAEARSTGRRRERRREAIARACTERLAHESYAEARLEALAVDAGLTRQNLLFYFRDKADLWAEATACASEDVFRVLERLVTGEAGPAAVRALRRGLDEVARVLPAPLAIVLDAPASPTRASAAQQARAGRAQAAFLHAFAQALAEPRAPTDATRRLARFAYLALLAHHREVRGHHRSGLAEGLALAAELDYAEDQLVALARVRRTG